MRRVLALGALMVMVGAAAYACSNDTFTSSDAAAEGGPVDPTTAFCNATATYDKRCFPDASCIGDNAGNCAYAAAQLSPALINAYAACQGQLTCGTDVFTAIGQSCVLAQLAGFVSDSGAFAKLQTDLCAACYSGPNVAKCESSFTEAGTVGNYLGLFSDTILNGIDDCVPKDAGTTTTLDASACTNAFGVCALAKLALSVPRDACQDGGL